MIKQLIVITVVDVVLLGLFVYSTNPDPSIAIGIIIIIPIIFLINIFIGIVLKALKNKWANVILINSIIASLVFNELCSFAIERQTALNYKTFYFRDSDKDYELNFVLEKGKFKDSLTYEIYERISAGSITMGFGGRYKIKNDTLLLIDDSSINKNMKMFGNALYDYPETGKKVNIDLK